MTLDDLVNEIKAKGQRFKDEWGYDALDLFVGPEEFELMAKNSSNTRLDGTEEPPVWHYQLAPMFYKGLRVWLLANKGVQLGIVSHRS